MNYIASKLKFRARAAIALTVACIALTLTAAPASAAAPTGYIDTIWTPDGLVAGWAADPDAPCAALTIHFQIDGVTVGASSQRFNRSDVPYCSATNTHGFYFQIPWNYRDGNVHTVSAYAYDSSTGGTWLTPNRTFQLFNRAPIGWLDAINNNAWISGWTLDQDEKCAAISAHVYVDGSYAGALTTNSYRGDVHAAYPCLSGPTNHGYTWDIPPQYLDGTTHTLYVYGLDHPYAGNNTHLSGSPKQFTYLPPTGYIDTIAGDTILGWALDPNWGPLSSNPTFTLVDIYMDGPANIGATAPYDTGQLIGTVVANQTRAGSPGIYNHGFSYQIPLQYRQTPGGANVHRRFFAVARAARGNLRTELPVNVSNSIGSPPPTSATATGSFGGSTVTLTASAQYAGAISSLTWNGLQFVDTYDHGREIQSASFFDQDYSLSSPPGQPSANPYQHALEGVCFNPNEAGNFTDTSTSTSQLQALTLSGKTINTQTRMAFWVPPTNAGHYSCSSPHGNNNYVSNHVVQKTITMGPTVGATTFGDNVMRFDVRFRTPTQEIHPKLWPGQTQAVPTGFESLTGYMPATLSVRYRYEPNGTLTAMTGVNIRYSTCPIVFSNTSGSHAMAILDRQVVQTNSLSSGYHGGWTVFSGVFKWASSHNVSGTVSAGSTYGPYENYVVIGSLNHVRSGLAQLWSALGFSSSLACATQ